jgi:lipase chaperone LimK
MSPAIADLFFGEEEASDRYVIERARIAHDASLTDQEKTAAILAMANQLPAPLAEKEAKSHDEAAFDAEINRLKQANDTAGVLALRESRYGSIAAARLATLDQKNEVLNRRIDAFHRCEKSITNDPSLTSEEKARRIDDTQKKNFSEWERPILKRFNETTLKKGDLSS